MPKSPLILQLMDGLPNTAAALIVTIYGDIVVPRGEILWMGSLIGIADRLGISENLVRTAVSRLVAAGRLEGERVGRRSFYNLAPSARAEFSDAERLLYGPRSRSRRWTILHAPDLPDEVIRAHRMARIGGDVFVGLDAPDPRDIDGVVFRAEPVTPPELLAQIAGYWDLQGLQARYRALLDRFRPLAGHIGAGATVSPEDALIARLLLVHVYRGVVLRDPGLPPEALPQDWCGDDAAGLFRSLYVALSPQADAQVARMLKGRDGALPEHTARILARLNGLR